MTGSNQKIIPNRIRRIFLSFESTTGIALPFNSKKDEVYRNDIDLAHSLWNGLISSRFYHSTVHLKTTSISVKISG